MDRHVREKKASYTKSKAANRRIFPPTLDNYKDKGKFIRPVNGEE